MSRRIMSFIEAHANVDELNAQLTQIKSELDIQRSYNGELKRKMLENLCACPVDELNQLEKELEELKKLLVAKQTC
jgi:conjugal transfer/entry exclusion protein